MILVAGILKSLMVLERGIIPPNALFEKINPDIDLTLHNTAVCRSFPTFNVDC